MKIIINEVLSISMILDLIYAGCIMQLVIHPIWMDENGILCAYRLCIHSSVMFLCQLGGFTFAVVKIGRLGRVIPVMIGAAHVL